MRAKVIQVKCQSVQDLQYEFLSIQHDISLVETEESWDTISRAVSRINSLANNGAAQFPSQLISSLRSISRPLANSLNSERSRLSGASLELFSTLAVVLESSFGPLIPIFLPTLLTMCTRTNKVFCMRAKSCILDIIEHTRLPAIFSFLVDSLKDKSVTLRLAAAEAALACLNTFDPPDLTKESRAREIETVMRCTIKDPSADIRQVSRKIFDAYNILIPERVDAFVDPLSPTAKKYLNIKPMTIASSSSNGTRKAGDKPLPQSSSSSSQLQRSLRDAKAVPPDPILIPLPPSRPGSKVEHQPTKPQPPNPAKNMIGNHQSSGSVNIAPKTTTLTRQPIAFAPRVGPVRLAPAQSAPAPVRQQSNAPLSRVNGHVRLLATAPSGPRSAPDGPRRVTIVPMPPPSKEAKVPAKPVAASTKPAVPVSSRAMKLPADRVALKNPVPPRVPGPVLKANPKSTANSGNSRQLAERPAARANSSSTGHTTAKTAQAPQALPSKKGQTSKASKTSLREKPKEVVIQASETEVAALIPLPPSPTILTSKDAVVTPGVIEGQIVSLDKSEKTPIVDTPVKAKPSRAEQTPITALLISIERGFALPDSPRLPALPIVDEGEDESFDIPKTASAPVTKALNIRPKSSHEKGSDRLILSEMQVNR